MITKAYLLPGMPHPLLCPEKNRGWGLLRQAYDKVRSEIEQSEAELILIYSTFWPSVIGHQIFARAEAQWTHVDEEFHALGSIPYRFKMDEAFGELYKDKCLARKLHARTVNYQGFPVDTGSVVALKLLNPENRLKAVITSSNVYSDRAETLILGKAAREALESCGKKAVALVISALSNRLHQGVIEPQTDRIHSLKDDEWNRKFLEFLEQGRLEDVAQLSRQFHREARVHKVNNFKPFWWLSSLMGQSNLFKGQVFEYQPVCGTGAAVVGLESAPVAARDLEFDETDPETYSGERNVLAPPVSEAPLENEAEAEGEVGRGV